MVTEQQDQNQPIDEKLLEQARSYGSIRLNNIITQPQNYSKEMIAAAKIALSEKGTANSESSANVDYFPLIEIAKGKIESHTNLETIRKELLISGASEADVEKAIFEASKVADLNKKTEKKEGNSGMSIGGIILIILFIIKILLNMARN